MKCIMKYINRIKKTKVHTNNIPPLIYQIKCSTDGYIMDIDDNTLSLLLYEKDNIVNQFIGIIMSPFMNYIHKNILLPKYAQMSDIQKNIAHIFLSALSTRRPLIIYNILNFNKFS